MLDFWWERMTPGGASVKMHPAVGALGEESRHLELSHRPGHRSPEAISAPPRREALDSGGWVVTSISFRGIRFRHPGSMNAQERGPSA